MHCHKFDGLCNSCSCFYFVVCHTFYKPPKIENTSIQYDSAYDVSSHIFYECRYITYANGLDSHNPSIIPITVISLQDMLQNIAFEITEYRIRNYPPFY